MKRNISSKNEKDDKGTKNFKERIHVGGMYDSYE